MWIKVNWRDIRNWIENYDGWCDCWWIGIEEGYMGYEMIWVEKGR